MADDRAWLDSFVARPMHTYLDEAVALYRDRPAVDFLGRKWTWGELGDQVDRAAAGFKALGVGPGVHVGLCLPNTPYYTICYFAVMKIGGTVVNFNPLYVEREISFQASDSGTRIMVTLDLKAIYDKIEQVRADGVLDTIVVCSMADILPPVKRVLFGLFKGRERAEIPDGPAHVPFTDLLAKGRIDGAAEINADSAIAVLQYTGGTTGTPKGAMLTHRNLSANLEQVRVLFASAKAGAERKLCVIPFFHVFAMTAAQNLCVMIGAEMILLPRFDLKQLLGTVKRTKPTLFPGVPTLFTAINNAPETKKYDLSSIRLCISGGAPLPAEVRENFQAITGCALVEGYGLTEAAPVTHCNPIDGEVKAGSIGLPLIGTRFDIRDLEDNDKSMPQGEKGELLVSGPQVMAGYWNRPIETEMVLKDGWLKTGDVGYVDEDGYVFLVDRIKDLIICSGYNVYPRVIEEAIYQHPAAAEVIVIAIPDKYRGQAPKAFVKLKDGMTSTPSELLAFLEGHLSKIEMPREIEFRDELPKTLVGKLSKKELVEEEEKKRGNGDASS